MADTRHRGRCIAGRLQWRGQRQYRQWPDSRSGTVDFPIAYVKRTIPEDDDDLRQQRDTAPDAELFFRDRAAPSSLERNITGRVTGTDPYDIKDVDVSPDGKKIVFAMRGPLGANQDEEDHLTGRSGNTTSRRTTCTA